MLIGTAILLSACGGSGSGGSGSGSSGGSFGSGGNLNPLNWFRSDPADETVETVNFERPVDRRPLVAEITALVIERMPGGAIVRATGLPPEQGWHTAELVRESDDQPADGVLTYAFRAVPPATRTRVSTQQSRELTVARFLSDFDLASIRQIRVVGARNARVARR